MTTPTSKIAVVAIALVAGYFLFKPLFKTRHIENPFPSESRAHLPYEEFVKKLVNIPDFERKLGARAGTTDPSALGMEISQGGLKRLDDAMLDRRMELLIKLVEFLDVRTCAALSRSDPAQAKALAPKLMRALENLPASDIRAFFDLVVSAVQAELNNTAAPAFSQARGEQAMRKLVEKFSAEEQALLVRVINYPATASDESSCWIVKTVFSEILDLPAADRHAVSRMLVLSADKH